MDQFSTSEDEIINFPVPKRYLSVVIQALAKAMEQATGGAADLPTIQTGEQKQAEHSPIDWTDVNTMKTLRDDMDLPIGIKLLDLTAAQPGQIIPFEKVYKAVGFTEAQRAGSSLGALTKTIKRAFHVPKERAIWPVQIYQGYKDDPQFHYSMSPEVAQAWLQSAL